MLISIDGDKIVARNSFNDKDRLKEIGFRYYSKDAAWKASFSWTTLVNFVIEFKNDKIKATPDSKKYLIKASRLNDQRLKKIDELEALRTKLLSDPSKIVLPDLKLPEGIVPYDHQKVALEFLRHTPVGNVFADCGLGKTFTMLCHMQWLKNTGKASKFLVVCPKSVIYGAWIPDCHKFTPDLSICALDRGAEVNKQILYQRVKNKNIADRYNRPFDIYAVNFESLSQIVSDLEFLNFECCILDESSKLKNPKSKITKTFIQLADLFKYKYILSGMPAPNHELEYWAQIRFLSGIVFGANYYAYRERYFDRSGFMGHTWTFKEPYRDEFNKKIYTYGLRFREEDCLDLPDQTSIDVPVKLSEKISEYYKVAEHESVIEIKKKTYGLTNPLAALTKLRQVANGFIMIKDPEDRTRVKFIMERLHDEKLKATSDIITAAGPDEQVIIWACFKEDIKRLLNHVGDKHGTVDALWGQTKDHTKVINDFKIGDTKYLVIHPKSAAHGLTFTNCRYNIFYSMDWSSELYWQAIKRTRRIGQNKHVFYYHLLAETDGDKTSTVDHTINWAVKEKITDSKQILDYFFGLIGA